MDGFLIKTKRKSEVLKFLFIQEWWYFLLFVCFFSGTVGEFIAMIPAMSIVAAMFAILPALILSTVFSIMFLLKR